MPDLAFNDRAAVHIGTMRENWRAARALRGVSPAAEGLFLKAAAENAVMAALRMAQDLRVAWVDGQGLGSRIALLQEAKVLPHLWGPALEDFPEDAAWLDTLELPDPRVPQVIWDESAGQFSRHRSPDGCVEAPVIELARTTARYLLTEIRNALPREAQLLWPALEVEDAPGDVTPWIELAVPLAEEARAMAASDLHGSRVRLRVAEDLLMMGCNAHDGIEEDTWSPSDVEEAWARARVTIPDRIARKVEEMHRTSPAELVREQGSLNGLLRSAISRMSDRRAADALLDRTLRKLVPEDESPSPG